VGERVLVLSILLGGGASEIAIAAEAERKSR
jgi:hypothetical protein